VVKRAASDCLAKYGIHKADAEFKEIWGFIYRGTEFALVRLDSASTKTRAKANNAESSNAVTCHRQSHSRKVCQSARRDVCEGNGRREQ
jgi:hypothetical protein